MKRALLTMSVLLFVTAIAWGQNNTKYDGFRGLKWGTNIADVKGMVLEADAGNDKSYFRKEENLTVGDAKLEYITYYFYKGQFASVIMKVKGETNIDQLLKSVVAAFGSETMQNKPSENEGRKYVWRETKNRPVAMLFHVKSEVGPTATFFMCYMPISAIKNADEDKAAAANKAKATAKDF